MREVHSWIRELQSSGPVVSDRRSKDPLRFMDNALGMEVVQILPGDCYVSSRDELLSTVLGSCISVCLYDPVARLGGMNHYLLPEGDKRIAGTADAARYGNFAMNELIATLVELGARKSGLEAKVFGGGAMFTSEQDVGQRNIKFADEYLKNEHIEVVGRDVGLPFSRKIRFSPVTGKVMVKRLPSLHQNSAQSSGKQAPDSGLDNGPDSDGGDDLLRKCG
ncbi:hypothetical protein AB833_32200 [Chromatiales bacterium (ex Bugula neritina AB1)]|nr:hypothetical protein AB833_32200 [Chromatiales bacterium (ex Bugula neritina AB1)]